jgi:cytohesin
MSLPEHKFEGYSQIRLRHAPDIWMAARFGLVAICSRLLSTGCDPNQLAADKSTALIENSKQNYADITRLLLQYGARATLLSLDDRSALHEAAIRGHIEVARVLIQQGVAVDIAARSGRTPLHDAVSAGKEAMVDFLISQGADPSSRTAESHWTVLHTAANAGNVAIAHSLCNARANRDAKTSFHQTPLFIAAEHGHDAMIECLLDRGASMETCDLGGNSAVHIAAREGRDSSVLLLHHRGVSTDSENIHGDTVLHVAASSGHVHVLCLLLGQESSAQTPSEVAGAGHGGQRGRFMEACPDLRLHVSSKNKNGQTPLHVAVINGHGEAVSLLLQAGASVNDTCFSPLHARIIRCSQERHALNSLLDSEQVYTALDIAVSCGHDDLIEILKQRGGVERLHVPSTVRDKLNRQIEETTQTMLAGAQRRMMKEINAMLGHLSEKPFRSKNPCRNTAFVPIDGNLVMSTPSTPLVKVIPMWPTKAHPILGLTIASVFPRRCRVRACK